MSLEQITRFPYAIIGEDNEPFSRLRFGDSTNRMWLHDAVADAREAGGVLQSIDEAAAFSMAAQGAHYADDYYLSRTGVIHFMADGKWQLAVSDSYSPNSNIILAKASKGVISILKNNSWKVPITDHHIKATLKQAEKAGRIVEIPESPQPLELATGGMYGAHAVTRALMPQSAAAYDTYLRSRGHSKAYIWLIGDERLKATGIDENTVEVRAAGISINTISCVTAIGTLNCNYSHSRAVLPGGRTADDGDKAYLRTA